MNFNFGKKKPSIKEYAIIGVTLSIVIGTLSQCTGLSENNLWDLLDEIQRKYFPLGILNEFVIKDPERLNRRVERDVSKAIDNYLNQSPPSGVDKPHFIEHDIDSSVCYTDQCKSLGGEMRLCAPWLDGCSETPPKNE